MIPLIWGALRYYGAYIMFPVAVVIGTIGYHVEKRISDRQTPFKRKSIEQERDERQLHRFDHTSDATQVESLKKKSFVPKSIFEINLSPSLQTTAGDDQQTTNKHTIFN